jgi:methionyl-tRNA formyltransferase
LKSNILVIASPHNRNKPLVDRVKELLACSTIVPIVSKKELSLDNLESINPDFIFFPHWSWIIPEDIYTKYPCVIFHMTDLPYGRGGSPLQNLIVRGHEETMLSAIKCVSEVDAGPIYKKVPLSLKGTAEEVLQRASVLMEDLIVDIVNNHQNPIPQVGKVVSFLRRKPEDGDIAKLDNLEKIYDYIRMLDADGYPPAFIDTIGLRFNFSQAIWNGEILEAKVQIMRKNNE